MSPRSRRCSLSSTSTCCGLTQEDSQAAFTSIKPVNSLEMSVERFTAQSKLMKSNDPEQSRSARDDSASNKIHSVLCRRESPHRSLSSKAGRLESRASIKIHERLELVWRLAPDCIHWCRARRSALRSLPALKNYF